MTRKIHTHLAKLSMMLLLSLLALGCTNVKSDPDIEKQIDGTWKATYTETDYEDGEPIVITVDETTTYNATTHTMQSTVVTRVTSPISMHLATVTFSGTWRADKDNMLENYTKSSFKFDFNPMLSKSEQKEFKDDMLSDVDEDVISEIVSISQDQFVVNDGENTYTYTRVK